MPATVYRSRSRTVRNRLLSAAGVVVLVLAGFLIGRAQGAGDRAAATTVVPSAPPAPVRSSDSPSPAPTGGRDAYRPLQAEDAAEVSGVDFEDTADEGGGKNAGWIANGDWLRFDEVNFGDHPPAQLNVRLAAGIPQDGGGRLEIRVDSPSDGPAATLETSSTGGWQNWRTEATGMAPVTGLHTVYVTFGSDRPDEFLNVNWLVFRR